MHIKLISPRMSLRPMDSEFKRRMAPSLALLTVGALTPPEHTVTIEDENVQVLHLDDCPDLVGITVNVDTAHRAYAIADAYRQRGIPVVLGGIHPSAKPEEAMQHADAVCVGEAEEVWKEILAHAARRQLHGEYYSPRPADLSNTPRPRWELIDPTNYLYTNIVCASRGCPFTCEFCYNSAGYVHHEYRNRPIEQVVAEIQQLDTRHVMFIDDNFIGNIGWTRAFLQAIAPLHLKWNAAVSVNIGRHLDLLDEMQRSGCQSLFIGFETVNGDSVRSVRKYQNHVTEYEQLIHEIHRRGIMVNASLVFGFDHDYPNVFRKTLVWLVHNKVETVTSHILTPYPGTQLYERMTAEGRMRDLDWSHFNTSHVVFQPRHMTPAELYQGYLWLYREFYSLPSILRRMPEVKSRRVPFLLFNLGYRKFGKATSRLGRGALMGRIGRLSRRLAYGMG
jgi:radical SAM superfamily enzyme YgiQ (UPF0313 family)